MARRCVQHPRALADTREGVPAVAEPTRAQIVTTFEIPLRDGFSTIVDRADADLVAGFAWRMLKNGYVNAQRGQMYLYIHRLVAGAGPRERVDHINRNPLDNRASNLRIATGSQNGANRIADQRRAGTSSRHKGVYWDTSRSRWHAGIHVNGRSYSLGRFATEDEAARAYNAAALDHWGEFARLNDVPD